MATNKNRCLLAGQCKLAGTSKCNNLCGAFIGMHGHTGNNGRSGATKLPREYKLTTLANSPVREAQPNLYGAIDAYVSTFDRQFNSSEAQTPKDRIKSLYLFSEETGTGKTTTASAILNEWLVQHYVGSAKRGLKPVQLPAYFLDVNEWQTYYNQFTRSGIPDDVKQKASREFYRRMQYATTAPFAVLDDIGVRNATDGFRGDLHSVINARVTNQLPTIYTSNIPMTEIETVFDKRLYDRVRDLCTELYFTGNSKRGKRI